MAMDQQDERKQVEAEEPASGLGAIRSAYLARQSQDTAPSGEGETVAATLRGVYVSQVGRQTRRRDDAVKGSEETGGTVLRSIYAARAEIVAVAPRRAARPAPARKAKAAKKARPARKARPAPKARPAAKAKAKARSTGRAVRAKRRPARKAARRR